MSNRPEHSTPLWILIILIFSASFFTVFTIISVNRTLYVCANFLQAKATIVEIHGGTPIYQFINPRTGIQIRAEGTEQENPSFRVGDEVLILYDPINPTGMNGIVDRYNIANNPWLTVILGITSLGTWALCLLLFKAWRGNLTRRKRALESSSTGKRENPVFAFIS